jgi:hypothetical protein
VQRADEPSHVFEVSGAAVAVGEVRVHPRALAIGQCAFEVVGDEFHELAANERIVAAATPRPAHQ